MTPIIYDPSDFSAHEIKPIKLIAEDYKIHWLSRHVKWLKEERHGWHQVTMVALAALEILVLTISVVGWVFLYRGLKESQRQDAKAKFFQQIKNAKPPSDDLIELKFDTCTFNHVQDFAISDKVIWARLRHHHEKTWKPIFFDGFVEGDVPYSLDSDGANLIVTVLDRDNKKIIHYKKVLREIRNIEIKEAHRAHFKQAGVNLEKDAYIAVDKSERDNWKDIWFSFHFIHIFLNLFTGKRLEIPSDAEAWAISHRGRYNNYVEDKAQQPHYVGVGTTTLSVLDGNRRDIYKNDPWLPKHVKIIIPLPETSQMFFEAEKFRTSASTILAIGYEVQKDKPEECTLQIYTCLTDLDLDGLNPGYQYGYFKHVDNPNVWVVPVDQWDAHPLQLDGNDFITKDITILQTGEGNDARQLRIAGQYKDQKGFYFKKINEKQWHFEALDNQSEEKISQANALSFKKAYSKGFHTTVYDYAGQSAKFYSVKFENLSVQLRNFGQRALHSKLIVEIDRQDYLLDLHKKKTFKNLLGFQEDTYELVIPEAFHHDDKLLKAFKKQTVIPLKISENKGILTIEDQNTHCFKFMFKQEDEQT